MTSGYHENVLVEGTIGQLQRVEFAEGMILEVVGNKGVLRINLEDSEIKRTTHQGSEKTMIEISTRSMRMYKIGGFSLIIVGVSYLIGAILSLIIGPAPSGVVEYMNALAAHRLVSLTNFAFFTIADIFLIPAVLALYIALKGTNKKTMIIASALMILFAVFDVEITELSSFELVLLTQNFAAATSDAQRSAVMITANNLLSTLPTSTACSFVVSSVGLLILALVMSKSSFTKHVALPGLTAGIAGTIGGFYIIAPVLSLLLMPSLVAMGIWGIFAGSAVRKIK